MKLNFSGQGILKTLDYDPETGILRAEWSLTNGMRYWTRPWRAISYLEICAVLFADSGSVHFNLDLIHVDWETL